MFLRRKGVMDEKKIKLGNKYRDTITGFEGTATGKHEYIHGCTRITLSALSGGDIKECSFDAPALRTWRHARRSRRAGLAARDPLQAHARPPSRLTVSPSA